MVPFAWQSNKSYSFVLHPKLYLPSIGEERLSFSNITSTYAGGFYMLTVWFFCIYVLRDIIPYFFFFWCLSDFAFRIMLAHEINWKVFFNFLLFGRVFVKLIYFYALNIWAKSQMKSSGPGIFLVGGILIRNAIYLIVIGLYRFPMSLDISFVKLYF